MTSYQELTSMEKLLFNRIEQIFIDHPTIPKYTFSRICRLVADKYKYKVQK